MRLRLTLPLLLLTTSLFAQPVITAISPSEGPTTGGTVVTITGSGFGAGAVEVKFGTFRARSAERISDTTLRVVTPGHPPGLSHVTVLATNGSTIKPDGYRFVGIWRAAFHRVLMPIFIQSVKGAYGSEFRTSCDMWNRGTWEVWIFGAISGFIHDYDWPLVLQPGTRGCGAPNGRPGRFFDIKDLPDELPINLRAYDVSRSATDLGTEIPVVPESEFRSRITLIGVPVDARYRVTLRIYGAGSGNVVDVDMGTIQRVALRDAREENDPAYAEMSFSAADLTQWGGRPGTITITSVERAPGEGKPLIWAFATLTNNETQHITTITPQPSR